MKILLIAFAVIATVSADVSHLPLNEYLPPVKEAVPIAAPQPSNEYLPPLQQFVSDPTPVPVAPAHQLTDDGYRYKTQRRVVYRRHRRDVSHLPSNDYLPPVQQESVPVLAPIKDYLPPVQQVGALGSAPVAPAHELTDDGYRYKTQRRVVYRRNRRDVSHLPTSDYLPPAAQEEYVPVEVAPIQEVSNTVVEEAAPAHELADDGYRYKTQRRIVYRRNRRDVSHLPVNDYLPPVKEASPVLDAPVQEINLISEGAPAHELADDGYRYKTQRRVVYRHRNRRDVSHLVSDEYLPPTQEIGAVDIAPVQPVSIIDEAAAAHELADDGYQYKTQRRIVYRRSRRDVSHLPSNDYLPPVQQEYVPAAAPVNDYLPPVQHSEAAPAHDLSNDGYRYKTQRRVVYRRH